MSDFCQDCGNQFEDGDETITTSIGFICGGCANIYWPEALLDERVH